jgi:hypothetical protein
MTINYPGGHTHTTTNDIKPREPRKPRERRVSPAGENNQFTVRKPPKDSPVRVLSAIYEHSGWETAYIKFPCGCEDWTNRGYNAVVVWRNMEHRIWCVCQVSAMSEQVMREEAA